MMKVTRRLDPPRVAVSLRPWWYVDKIKNNLDVFVETGYLTRWSAKKIEKNIYQWCAPLLFSILNALLRETRMYK
jgi:hypothetical protein